MKYAHRIRTNLFADVWGFALLMYPFSGKPFVSGTYQATDDVIDRMSRGSGGTWFLCNSDLRMCSGRVEERRFFVYKVTRLP